MPWINTRAKQSLLFYVCQCDTVRNNLSEIMVAHSEAVWQGLGRLLLLLLLEDINLVALKHLRAREVVKPPSAVTAVTWNLLCQLQSLLLFLQQNSPRTEAYKAKVTGHQSCSHTKMFAHEANRWSVFFTDASNVFSFITFSVCARVVFF